MKVESVEWSLGKSPDSVVDIWSVAATMEAVILVLAEDNREEVSAILSKAPEVGALAEGKDPPPDSTPRRRRRAASR